MGRQLARENQFRWTLTVNGRPCGVWAEADGGDKDSEEAKTRPGAGEAEESLGGVTSYDNLTLTARYDVLFHGDLETVLDGEVGKGNPVTAVRQTLGRDDLPINGSEKSFIGTLKKLIRPASNSDGSDAANLGVELTLVAVV